MWSKMFLALSIIVQFSYAFSKSDFDVNSCPVQFPCPGTRAVARDENNCPVCVPLINITSVCVTNCPIGCSSQSNKKGCKLCYCPRSILTAFLPDDDPQFNSFKSSDISTVDFCNEDKDCKNAYSYCKAKKCVCVEGLERIKGVCVAPAASHNCPYDSPLSEGNVIKTCEYTFNAETRAESSTCPEKHFCFLRPQTRSKSGKMVGHCCPVPPEFASSDSSPTAADAVCPFGQPVKGASCPDTSDLPADSAAPPDKIRTCPYYTHECVNNKYNKTQVCCLNPCRASSSHFDVEGKCYDYVIIGDRCEIDAQCIGGSKCQLNDKNVSVCTCKSGSVTSSRTACEKEKKKTPFENLKLPNKVDDTTVCRRGYVKDGATCREISSLTELCTSNDECSTVNTECRSGFCVCNAGLIRDGFVCRHPLKIKEVCKSSGDCRTDGTSCVKGKCVCMRNYVRVAENCIESNIFTFLTCKSDSECKFANTTCSNGKCVCLPTHVRDGDVCMEKNYVNEPCKVTSDCKTQFSLCNNETCVCPLGHLRDGNHCVLTVTLQACGTHSDCKASNGWCMGNRCVCMPGYSRDGETLSGVCKMSGISIPSENTESINENCASDIDCTSTNGSVCVSGKCICMDGYRMENKRCIASPNISTSIDEPESKITSLDTQFCQKQDDCQTFQNTICKENKCQCMEGYVQDGLVCTKSDKIEQSCKSNEDCPSSFTCLSQKCVCMPGYLKDGNICVKPETIYMACTNDADCGSVASSFCSAKRCVCMKGYIRDGIVCRMPASITSGCDKDSDCSTNSTYCREKKCVCMSSYVRDGISCVPYDSLSQKCKEDRDCSGVNSTVCQAGKCLCMAGYERLDNGQCREHSSTVAAKIAELGGVVHQCTYNSECNPILKSSVCIESQCVCMSGYVRDGDTCRPAAEIDESCTDNSNCKTKSSICLQGKCVCMAGYVHQDGACELVVPSESCVVSDDCRIASSVCFNQKCACMSGYIRDGDACIPKDSLTETCQQDNDCKTTGSICRESKCICMPGYTKDGDECNLSAFVKETCRLDTDCKTAGTFCRGGKCVCMSNYIRHANLCITTKLYQSPAKCKTNDDCTMPNTACADDECVCMDGYQLDGGYCVDRNFLTYKCESGSDCNLPGTTCQNERCVCMNGYRRVNSVCQKLLTTSTPDQPDISSNIDSPAVSEVSCNTTTDCDIPANSVCIKGKCVCMNSDYIRDGDICVLKNDITSSCDAKSKCQVETAICSENKCVCMSGYIKDGENCVRTSFMPETCNADSECGIPGTVCRLKRCVCMAGYIRDGNKCSKLETLKVNCKKDNVCPANQTCIGGKCACMSNYARVNDQTCDKIIPPIGICKTGLNCPPGAFCLNGKCFCMTGYKTVGDSCAPPTSDNTDKKCLSELDCQETGTRCQDGVCVCMEGYTKVGGTCKPSESGTGTDDTVKKCSSRLDCDETTGTKCQDGICVCMEGYVKVDGVCKPSETATGKEDVCPLPPDTGNCRASITKWFWNPKQGACQTFIYGGCRGNGNRFDSKAECEALCAKGTTDFQGDSNKIGESIDEPGTSIDKDRQLEKACTADSDCTIPYSNCRNQICTCGEGFTVQNNLCVAEGKGVGESCSTDMECYMAFSKCIKRKCSCIAGFTQTPGGFCAPEKYNCPTGEPSKNETGSVVMCEINPTRSFESMPDASTCMAGYFCFASPHTKAVSGRLLGHCCPLPVDGKKVEPVCPVDLQLKGASCSERIIYPNRFQRLGNFVSEADKSGGCPATTHECLVSRYLPKTICCPLPCKNGPDRVNVQGKCYRRVMDGYVCEIDAQCDPNSYCSFDSSGTKRCRSSYWKRF